MITSSGAHLLELITDILEMSRLEAGRSTCDASEGDLHALLEAHRLRGADEAHAAMARRVAGRPAGTRPPRTRIG